MSEYVGKYAALSLAVFGKVRQPNFNDKDTKGNRNVKWILIDKKFDLADLCKRLAGFGVLSVQINGHKLVVTVPANFDGVWRGVVKGSSLGVSESRPVSIRLVHESRQAPVFEVAGRNWRGKTLNRFQIDETAKSKFCRWSNSLFF